MILGKSSEIIEFLEKVVQFGWLETPTSSSPLLFFELGIEYIKDHENSWMKMIPYKICISRIILIMKLFLQIFWEKILSLFKIILGYCSQLYKLTTSCCHRVLDTFWHATLYWNNVFRMNIDLNLLDNRLYSLNTWMNEDMVCPVWSWALEG